MTGRAAIREALAGFLAILVDFELSPPQVVQSGDLALLVADWTLEGTDPNGEPVRLGGRTSDVARRQADGTWLVAIDNPYGAAAFPEPEP